MCKYIYEPKGQALEYSELAANPYRGCGHKCSYCYVPSVLRMSNRKEFDEAAYERPGFLKGITREAQKMGALKEKRQVMLSFTTDPYHPFDTSLTRKTLEIFKQNNISFSILTKGGTRALRDIDLFDQKKDSFACTLTSVNDDFSLKWEKGAQPAKDRLQSLIEFKKAGIFTWVSLEPTIDVHESLKIIEETKEFVDFYKVGRVNYHQITKTTDWRAYTLKMIDLLSKYGKNHYIKKDLQSFLPENYVNKLRVAQHF